MRRLPFLLIVVFCCAGHHQLSASSSSAAGGLWGRWRAWYGSRLLPCLRPCPARALRFTCAYDVGRRCYALASSRCAIEKHNACYDREFELVPMENCLVFLKYNSNQDQDAGGPPTLPPQTILRLVD